MEKLRFLDSLDDNEKKSIYTLIDSLISKKKLKDKPIITLIGCRNMWIMAQEKMKKLIHNIGGKLIDNVVLNLMLN